MAFEVLAPAYPGHSISVRAYPNGGFFITDLRFEASQGRWGMNVPRPKDDYSISAYKKAVIMAFGEWLERAHAKRGLYEEGQTVDRVEGLPKKYQPNQTIEVENLIVDTSGQPLRTEPRPQAVNGLV